MHGELDNDRLCLFLRKGPKCGILVQHLYIGCNSLPRCLLLFYILTLLLNFESLIIEKSQSVQIQICT
jgi:hypothetical protein